MFIQARKGKIMNIIERIFDAATGETQDIERPLSVEELTILEELKKENEAKAKVEAELQANRLAILAKLGLTEDEAKLLLS
jgi:hypothetical protein